MSRRAITAPIVVGALAGGLAAWFFGSDPGAGEERKSAAVAPPPSAANAPARVSSANVAPRASAANVAPSVASADASPPASAASAPKPTPTPVFDLSAPATEPDLMTAQIGCNRQIPEDCERAGRSLESGNAGVTDAARARGLKRIALTLYVKQCETNRVAACLRLAEMYDVGEIVQANPKNADALRVRAKTLCSARPADADCRQ